MDNALPECAEKLVSFANLIVVASPGAGKTTRLPIALAHDPRLCPVDKKILVLVPRRIAAVSAAYRVAQELGQQTAQDVGFHVRFDKSVGEKTKVTYVTEGMFFQYLKSDRLLREYSVIIFDEFHERSLQADLALGICRELQLLDRPELRLVVMSATLQTDRLAKYLDAQSAVVQVPGRLFPVEAIYSQKPMPLITGPDFNLRVANFIDDLVSNPQSRRGDILVFLPGAGEIRRVAQALSASTLAQAAVYPLHGALDLEEQNQALRQKDSLRIILATNVAETSLTVEGVATVIDTGLRRQVKTDKLGLGVLELSRISRASATQRMGRAGREQAGFCYKLYTTADEVSMSEYDAPEIYRADLSQALSVLFQLGINDVKAFSWFEQPPLPAINLALRQLDELSLLTSTDQLPNAKLKKIAFLPLAPRLGTLVALCRDLGICELGFEAAAWLSEFDMRSAQQIKDFGSSAHASDLFALMQLPNPSKSQAFSNLERVIKQWRPIVQNWQLDTWPGLELERIKNLDPFDRLNLALCFVFSDRVVRIREKSDRKTSRHLRGKLVHGPGVTISTPAGQSEYVLALQFSPQVSAANEIEIVMAHQLLIDDLRKVRPHDFKKSESFEVTIEPNQALEAWSIKQERYRDLSVGEEMRSRVNVSLRQIGVDAAGAKQMTNLAERVFTANESLKLLLARLEFLAQHEPRIKSLLKTKSSMVSDFARALQESELRLNEIESADLGPLLLENICFAQTEPTSALSAYSLLRTLDAEAPATFKTPVGRFVPIFYVAGRRPFIQVKMQELFGCKSLPKLGFGAVRLTIEFLAPNNRPLQVTDDLERFWQGSYQEIRKEMRSRYPKHNWPEDPANAEPASHSRQIKK